MSWYPIPPGHSFDPEGTVDPADLFSTFCDPPQEIVAALEADSAQHLAYTDASFGGAGLVNCSQMNAGFVYYNSQINAPEYSYPQQAPETAPNSTSVDGVMSRTNSANSANSTQITIPEFSWPSGDAVFSGSSSATSANSSEVNSPENSCPQWAPTVKPKFDISPDTCKARAETQRPMTLTMDHLDNKKFKYIRFVRKFLNTSRCLVKDQERMEREAKGDFLLMDVHVVCASAVDEPAGLDLAFKRARGEAEYHRREREDSVSKLAMDDPTHPQNGGEILICKGCAERERKRYDRRKKPEIHAEEWKAYREERVVIINEKEFKPLNRPRDNNYSPNALRVQFQFRIACYCRHQEAKSPAGYRLIFTFRDASGALIAQHISSTILVTDDHKKDSTAIPAQQPVPFYHYPVIGPINGQFVADASPINGQFVTDAGPVNGQFVADAGPVNGQFGADIAMDDQFGSQVPVSNPPMLHEEIAMPPFPFPGNGQFVPESPINDQFSAYWPVDGVFHFHAGR